MPPKKSSSKRSSPKKMPSRKKGVPSPAKAKKILRDGEVEGRKLTAKQKRFFGAIAGRDE